MLPNVVSVARTGPYRLRLRFDDGAEGEIDVKEMIPLIVWPNGADLDPLVLHSKITGLPITLNLPSAQAGR